MSAQGNINYPHGTRTILGRSIGSEEGSSTFRFIDPITLDEITRVLPLGFVMQDFEIPSRFTQVELSRDTYTSPVLDLGAQGEMVHVLMANVHAQEIGGVDAVRVWDLDHTFLGSVIFINNYGASMRITMDGVVNIVGNNDYILYENMGNWVYPDNTDISNWFAFPSALSNAQYQIEVWSGSEWELRVSTFMTAYSGRVRIVWWGDPYGNGEVLLTGGELINLVRREFLWQYFEPALSY